MAYNPINLGPTTTANSQAVVLPSDQVAIPITDNGGSLTVDGTVTANAGTGNFTVVQSTATSLKTQAEVYEGGSPVSITNPLNVALTAVTTGGVTPVTGSSVGGASSIAISASPVQVYGWYFYNPNTVAAYISFYNASSASVGVTTPFYVLVIPPVGGANVFGIGITHGTAICIGISQGRALSTAMSTAVDYNIFYK